MTSAEELVQAAHKAITSGQFEQALVLLSDLIRRDPDDVRWQFSRAACLDDLGRVSDAEAAYQALLHRWPDHPASIVNYTELLIRTERLEAAEAQLSHLFSRGADLSVLKRLLQLRHALGHLQGVESVAEAILALDTHDFEARTALGGAFRGRRPEAALVQLRLALAEAPADPQAHTNLAIAYLDLGRGSIAVEVMKNALALAPDDPSVLMNLANALETTNTMMDLDTTHEAIRLYRRARERGGDARHLLFNLGTSYKRIGDIERARQCCRDLERELGPGGWSVRALMLMPRVYPGVAAIAAERHDIAEGLKRLDAIDFVISDPVVSVGETAFGMAYHNENDVDIQRQLANFYRRKVPELEWTAPHCQAVRPRGGKLRIGVVGSYLNNKTMDNLNEGLIRHLDRDQFELVLFRPGGTADAGSDAIDQLVEKVRYFGTSLEGAREIVAREECDILFYVEIGMVTLTYFLAFARLAPVQCTTWGHPDTTGIPAMDYFLSSSLLEPDGAEAHYSERLIRLRHLPTCYLWPLHEIPGEDRSGLGLPEGGRIYACPQNLMKVHPDFDWAIAEILRRDPEAWVVFTTSVLDVWRPVLHDRIRAAFPDVADRVMFLPQMRRWDFLRLLKVSDVILDPFYFSGGNSTHEALALGAPVVTWPGPYMRGRVSLACYRRMGIEDLVCDGPEHFVELALKVAHDRPWRAALSDRIAEKARLLFDNTDAIRAMEEFFVVAYEAAAKGEWIDDWPPA